jgi:hypothetical protein
MLHVKCKLHKCNNYWQAQNRNFLNSRAIKHHQKPLMQYWIALPHGQY